MQRFGLLDGDDHIGWLKHKLCIEAYLSEFDGSLVSAGPSLSDTYILKAKRFAVPALKSHKICEKSAQLSTTKFCDRNM